MKAIPNKSKHQHKIKTSKLWRLEAWIARTIACCDIAIVCIYDTTALSQSRATAGTLTWLHIQNNGVKTMRILWDYISNLTLASEGRVRKGTKNFNFVFAPKLHCRQKTFSSAKLIVQLKWNT
jgi:hypothetical protein